MQIQRVQNNNNYPQFRGKLSIIETSRTTETIASKTISKKEDMELYNMFVEFLGKKPESFASFMGGTWISKNKFNNYINRVNDLLKTNLKIEPKNNTESLLYHYSSDGKGNLNYRFGYFSSPYTIIHELHPEQNKPTKK